MFIIINRGTGGHGHDDDKEGAGCYNYQLHSMKCQSLGVTKTLTVKRNPAKSHEPHVWGIDFISVSIVFVFQVSFSRSFLGNGYVCP